jgi:hypothetical protein
MTDSQAVVVWGQVAARAAARGSDSDFAMCVTGVVSEQLAEVQLMPCHDVLASAAPVLAADLGDGKSVAGGRRSRWRPASSCPAPGSRP